LVQERSSQVLNGTGRLTVIPKAFHQPLVDFTEMQLSATIEREIDEEPFESRARARAGGYADLRHPSRLSSPCGG
jgi:hypothetical protein